MPFNNNFYTRKSNLLIGVSRSHFCLAYAFNVVIAILQLQDMYDYYRELSYLEVYQCFVCMPIIIVYVNNYTSTNNKMFHLKGTRVNSEVVTMYERVCIKYIFLDCQLRTVQLVC